MSDSEKRDRSAAMVPGSTNESAAAAPSGGAGPQGGLAGALQDALAKRKQKVSGSGKQPIVLRTRARTDYLPVQMMKRTMTMTGKEQLLTLQCVQRFATLLLKGLKLLPGRHMTSTGYSGPLSRAGKSYEALSAFVALVECTYMRRKIQETCQLGPMAM